MRPRFVHDKLQALLLAVLVSFNSSCTHTAPRRATLSADIQQGSSHTGPAQLPEPHSDANTQDVHVDVMPETETQQRVPDILRDAGAKDVKELRQQGLTGIEIVVVAVVAATALANLVIRLSQLWACGSIVDARGARVVVKSTCDVPRGTVVSIAPDNVRTTVDRPTEASLSELLSAAAKAQH